MVFPRRLPTSDSSVVKFGYPPKPLPVTSGTLSSIPITRGEQVIVTSVPATTTLPQSQPQPPTREPTPAPSTKAVNQTLSAPSPLSESDIPVESAESVALPGRDAGFLQLRVVPDDNSCLFSAVGVVFEGGVEGGKGLRKGMCLPIDQHLAVDRANEGRSGGGCDPE